MLIALFAKVNGEWRFEGFTNYEEKEQEFIDAVTMDHPDNEAFTVALPRKGERTKFN